MIPITSPEVEKYLHTLATRYDEPVVVDMETYGRANRFPIIDRLVGTMIHLLTQVQGARSVFELGSGYGYSAYWFLKAMGPEGKIHCTDGDTRNHEKATQYLTRAGLWNQVSFHVGEAIQTLQNTPGTFDIIYNDIDKGSYPEAWEVAKNRLRPGGLYICDNTLWSGRVAEAQVTDDIRQGWTEAIKDHNTRVYADKNFDATLIPLRDGVLIARKKL